MLPRPLLLLLVFCTAFLSADDRPNIILIMADDLGYETVGANGGTSYATPVLDRLAAEGMRFTHAYAQPLCTPSRVQIMTGRYNVRNYVRFGLLDPGETTFAQILRDAGYATAIVGKWQLDGDHNAPYHFGFDTYALWQMTLGRTDATGRDTRFPAPVLDIDGETVEFGPQDYGPQVVVDHAKAFMGEATDAGRPFLLYYPMILTHCPFVPTPQSEDWGKRDDLVMTYRGDPRYFGDMMEMTDALVGQLVTHLERLGARENTLLLFTGDNGTDRPVVSTLNGRPFAGAKGEMTNGGTHVPLIASWPAGIPGGGRVSDDLVDFSDFLPTLCDAAGVPVPAGLTIDGRSFLPQLRGGAGTPREWIYCWYARSGRTAEARAFVRDQTWKLYDDGRFYNVALDPTEQHPVLYNHRAVAFRRVLDRYAEIEAQRDR